MHKSFSVLTRVKIYVLENVKRNIGLYLLGFFIILGKHTIAIFFCLECKLLHSQDNNNNDSGVVLLFLKLIF